MRHHLPLLGLMLALTGCGSAFTSPVPTEQMEPLRILDLTDLSIKPAPADRMPTATQLVFQWVPATTRAISTNDGLTYDGQAADEGLVGTSVAGFWLCVHEISQDQWAKLVEADTSVSHVPWLQVDPVDAGGVGAAAGSLPAWGLSADLCTAALAGWSARSASAQLTLRLPSAAEWEAAARLPSGSARFGWGDTTASAVAGSYASVRETQSANAPSAIASRSALGGFYDMHGNVWEWVTDGTTPHLRGGSWCDSVASSQITNRRDCPHDLGYALAGVRPVLVLPP